MSKDKGSGYNVPIDLWNSRLSAHEYVRSINEASSTEEVNHYWNEAIASLSMEDLNFIKGQCKLRLAEIMHETTNRIVDAHRRLFS
jgi:hypothetical protein